MDNDYLSIPISMVNDSNLRNYIGKYVIVHGKVNSLKNNTLFLDLNPESKIEIIVKNFNQAVKLGSTLKVIGKVYQDLSLEFLDFIQLSDDFDLRLLNDMIPIIHHKEVESMFS